MHLAISLQSFFPCNSSLPSCAVDMFERLPNRKFIVPSSCAAAFLFLHHHISYASQFTIASTVAFSQDASQIPVTGLLGPIESAKHPIEVLFDEANEKLQVMQRKLTTFEEAITEYKRRYSREPPLSTGTMPPSSPRQLSSTPLTR